MADDEKKLENGEAEETVESKDWQWDASAPMAKDDFLNIELPEKEDEETEVEENDADEADSSEDEAVEEAVEIPENEITETGKEEKISDNSDVPPGCCIICGEKIRNSRSECYCNECRSKYMKVDYGATHIILSIIMVFLAVIGIVMFASTSKIAKSVSDADKLAKDGKFSAASDAYYEVDNTVYSLNERFNAFLKGISSNLEDITFYNSGSKISKKQAVIIAKTFSLSYDDAEEFFSLVESSFTDKELNSEKYSQVKSCYDYLKKFFNDYTKINTDLQGAYTPFFEAASSGSADKKDIEAQKQNVIKAIDKYAEENKNIDAGTIDYFKYTLLYYSQQYYGVSVENEEIYSFIKSAYDNAGEYSYLFYQDYASHSLNNLKYDETLAACDDLLKTNPSSADAYYYKALTYLRLEKYDDALTACDKVAQLSPGEYDYCGIKANVLRRRGDFLAAVDVCESVPAANKSAEISRQEAIAYYLSGDEDNALKYAKEAYDSAYAASYNGGAFSLEVVNTSALIYKLCGDEEDYDTIIETIKQSGAELEKSVVSVINGDTTFEDLFMSGKGDI